MKKIWEFVKRYYEIIGYCVLSLLLLGACFFPICGWLAAVAAIAFGALLYNESKIFGLILFMYCFYRVLFYQKVLTLPLEIIISGVLIAMMVGLYIYRVVKREYKLNWRILAPMGLFLVYILLPFHQCHYREFFAEVFFLALVYVAFEERKSFDFRSIARIFAIGLVVSCLYASLRPLSTLLSEKLRHDVYYNGVLRFSGLMYHPNTLNGMLFIVICGMLLLYYKQKISLVELLAWVVTLFGCGYFTLSRAFLVTTGTGVVVFTACYFVKKRGRALVLGVTLIALMCVLGGIFYDTSRAYFERISNGIDNLPKVQMVDNVEAENLEDDFDLRLEEWRNRVWRGEEFYDPGRHDLRALYWRDWSSSPKNIIFGVGVSKPLIGRMSSHNLWLQELWKHGIVGYFFYIAMIIGGIHWKQLKKFKIYLPFLMLLVPYLLLSVVEECLLDFVRIGFMLAAVGLLEQTVEQPVSEKTASTVEEKPAQ